MKKALAVLLSFAFVGAVFAADPAPTIAFSGYFNSGLRLDMAEDNDATATVDESQLVKLHAKDAGVNGYRFRLNGAYAMENAGINFRLQSQTDAAFTLAYGYAWVDLAKMVKVKAGFIDDGAWTTKGDIGGDFSDQKGIQVQYFAVPNLNAGFAVFGKDAAGGQTELDMTTVVLGGAYTVPNLLGVQFNAQMDNTSDTAESVALQKILLGANYLAMKGLTAAVEFRMERMAFDPAVETILTMPFTTITQKVAYKMDAIDAGLVAYEWMTGADVDDSFGFKVNPWASYTVGKHVPKLSIVYQSNNIAHATAPVASADFSTLSINPSYTYNATAKAKIVAGFQMDMVSEKPKVDNDASFAYVDFVWSF